MNIFSPIINYLLPVLGLLLVIIGIFNKRMFLVASALWVSLLALFLQYQLAGGEILGNYFNYENAIIYTLTMLILNGSLICYCLDLASIQKKHIRILFSFLVAAVLTGSLLILINVWINAHFISERLRGTPIIQAATFDSPDFCSYKYVFYKVSVTGKLKYLCPNHYGLIPSTGELNKPQELIIQQITQHKIIPKPTDKH